MLTLLRDIAALFVGDGVKVSAGVTVDVSVSLTLCPVVAVTEASVVGVFVPATEALIVFVNGFVKDNLLVIEPEEEALGVLL